MNIGTSSAKRTSTSLAGELDEDVAGCEASRGRRRTVDRAADERPASGLRRRQQRLHLETDPAPLDAALANDRLRDFARQIGGNRAGKPEADLVDADDLPLQVDERPAGVAAEDRRVVADPPHDRSDVLAVERHAVEGPEHARHDHLGVADDPHRHRLREGERTAERQHAVADLELRDVAERRDGKRARRRRAQPQHGDVRQRVGADEFRRNLLAVRERAHDRAGAAGDVVVRDDVAFRRDDRAAARRLALELAAVLVVDRDDVDPDQAGGDLRERRFDRRRRLVPVEAGAAGAEASYARLKKASCGKQSAHRSRRGNLLRTHPRSDGGLHGKPYATNLPLSRPRAVSRAQRSPRHRDMSSFPPDTGSPSGPVSIHRTPLPPLQRGGAERRRAGYRAHLDAGGAMMMALAGAMSTAELGVSLAEMIRQGKVHAICCTGANLEEDVFNLVAHSHYERLPHYRDLTPQDEQALLERHLNRVTDTCIPEHEAMRRHRERRARASGARPTRAASGCSRTSSSTRCFDRAGSTRHLRDRSRQTAGCVAAAEREPADLRARVGGFDARQHLRGALHPGHVQERAHGAVGDRVHDGAGRMVPGHEPGTSIGFFQIGGGIAGDFPICVVPMLHQDLADRRRAACGVTSARSATRRRATGRIRARIPNEKITWGKLGIDTPKFIIESDATIVAPLIFARVLNW